MAEKKLASTTEAVKKTDEKLGFGGRSKKWLRDMRSELRKVVWPTPKKIAQNTAVSLSVMAASAVVLWGFDWLADEGIQLLLKIGI